MILHAQSPCSWLSADGKYQIVHTVAGFGMSVFTVKHGTQERPFLTLGKAIEFCAEHEKLAEPVPEIDFATYSEQQR